MRLATTALGDKRKGTRPRSKYRAMYGKRENKEKSITRQKRRSVPLMARHAKKHDFMRLSENSPVVPASFLSFFQQFCIF
jgi:hypothetical protein